VSEMTASLRWHYKSKVTGRTAWKGDSSSGYSKQTAMERRWHDAADCSKHGQQRPETLGRRQSTL